MGIDDGGVEVTQVDDLGLLVTVFVQHRIGADEEEDADTHDQRAQHLQLVRMQVAREKTEKETR